MNDAWYFRDGQIQHGPMPLAELQRLIREGRINPNGYVSSPMTQNAWVPVAQALANQVPAQTDDGLKYVIPTAQTSGLSLAAGYMGIFSIVLCPMAPFALLVGILGLRDLKRNPGKNGYGRAWTGIVMGALGTIGMLVWLLSIVFAPRAH